MTGLFKKLNVLVQAGVNDVLGAASPSRSKGRRRLRPEELGKDVDREIGLLRQRLDEALAYEESLRTNLEALEAEAAQWNAQVDAALLKQDDSAARAALVSARRAEQRMNIATAELREHQLAAQELLQKVNMLESIVAQARRDGAAGDAVHTTEAPLAAGGGLANALREARERFAGLRDDDEEQTEATEGYEAEDAAEAEADLERRRQRLSK